LAGAFAPAREHTPPRAAIVQEILEDLKRTPAIQANYATTSLVSVGQGGMGAVFAAWDPNLERHQAIKVLTGAPTFEATTRFRGEAKLIATLKHKNLIKIYTFDVTDGGRPYFVMDLVRDAAILEAVIDNYFAAAVTDPTKVQWRSGDNQLIHFFRETLDAVAYLHDRGVIHHDLKPANILISPEKEVFVTDFGLSSGGSLSDSNLGWPDNAPAGAGNSAGFRGTLLYAAPEQLPGGGPITTRTDVYQLGLILRYMVLNQAPFETCPIASPGELFRRIEQAQDSISLYGDPLAVNPALPAELLAIIHKAIHKDPLLRYANATELKEDFEAFLDGRQVQAFSSSLSNPSRLRYRTTIATNQSIAWLGKNKGVATAVLASFTGLVGTGLVVIDKRNDAANARIAEVERVTKLAAELSSDLEAAERLVRDARQAENNGNLDAAVNLIQPELLQALRTHTGESSELDVLVRTLEKEHQARSTLVKMNDLELRGYAAAVSGSNPRVLGEFDAQALLEARACLLPNGLTPESIAEFARMMESSHFSQQQRAEIAGTIARTSISLMVCQNGTFPWDAALPVEVRQQLATECDMIARACAACRVEIEGDREIFAIPNTILTTKFSIESSYRANVEPPTFQNGSFSCDSTLTALHAVPVWKARSRHPMISPDDIQMPLNFARRAYEVNPKSFLGNIIYAFFLLNAPDNNDPYKRYKHLNTALSSLLTAHEQAALSKIENRDLATQICRLISEVTNASQAIPSSSRPELLATIVRGRNFLSSSKAFLDTAETERAHALLALLEGVSSDYIAEIGQSLRNRPPYERDALLISTLCDIYRGRPLNQQDAELLLKGGFEERAPLLSALVYSGIGRSEEAMHILEQIREKDPDWLKDIERMRTTYLRGLHKSHGERFSRLATQPR
jgi:serine/threonine protein kinase/tetratricopeptide (TPR) repeat protein